MRTDLAKVLTTNAKLKPDSLVVVVPTIPTVGMMIAAADTRNVFAPGDRLGDWLKPEREALEHDAVIDPGLVEAFGRGRSYELSVMAELWAGCIDGLDEWTRRRGLQGSDGFIDSWFRLCVHDCPAEGWPATADLRSEAHQSHFHSCRDVAPFAHDSYLLPMVDAFEVRTAPKLASSIMAMRGGQRELLFDYSSSIEETIRIEDLPFVPGYSSEHRMDYEERHYVFAAAAWKGAVSWLLNETRAFPEQMPQSPISASIFLSRMVYHHVDNASKLVKGYFSKAPYTKAVVKSSEGELVLTATGTQVSADYRHSSGRRILIEGYDIRQPWVEDDLMRLVREISAQGDINLEVQSTLNGEED